MAVRRLQMDTGPLGFFQQDGLDVVETDIGKPFGVALHDAIPIRLAGLLTLPLGKQLHVLPDLFAKRVIVVHGVPFGTCRPALRQHHSMRPEWPVRHRPCYFPPLRPY